MYRLTETAFKTHLRYDPNAIPQSAVKKYGITPADYFNEIVDTAGRVCTRDQLSAESQCCTIAREVTPCTCCGRYTDCVAQCITYPQKYSGQSRLDLENGGAE